MNRWEKTVEVAAGEFVHIPWYAWESFQRPAFAYTTLCPDKHLRRSAAASQRKGARK